MLETMKVPQRFGKNTVERFLALDRDDRCPVCGRWRQAFGTTREQARAVFNEIGPCPHGRRNWNGTKRIPIWRRVQARFQRWRWLRARRTS